MDGSSAPSGGSTGPEPVESWEPWESNSLPCARSLPQPQNSLGNENRTAVVWAVRWNKAVAERLGGGKEGTEWWMFAPNSSFSESSSDVICVCNPLNLAHVDSYCILFALSSS